MLIEKHIVYQLSEEEKEALDTVRDILISLSNVDLELENMTAWCSLDDFGEVADFLGAILDMEGSAI